MKNWYEALNKLQFVFIALKIIEVDIKMISQARAWLYYSADVFPSTPLTAMPKCSVETKRADPQMEQFITTCELNCRKVMFSHWVDPRVVITCVMD